MDKNHRYENSYANRPEDTPENQPSSDIKTADDREKASIRERKRAEYVKKHSPRKEYRRYDAKRHTYAGLRIQNLIASFLAVAIAVLYAYFIIVAVLAIVFSSDYNTTLFALLAGIVLISLPLKRCIKRLKFWRRLKKACRTLNLNITIKRHPLASLYRASGMPDFEVESKNCIWEVMFFPAVKRNSHIIFDNPEQATILTGITNNTFKMILDIKPRRRYRDYRFESSYSARKVNSVKILLLNPVPREIKYYDTKARATLPGSSGAEFFGYTACSGSGFINLLERSCK